MPYHVTKTDECPASKPWGVVKDADGEVMGCHETEEDARKQMAALYSAEKMVEPGVMTLKAATRVLTDEGVFEAVISTSGIDREKDIVEAAAMVDALRKWNRPIPLAWNHSTNAEDVFGSIEPMTIREAAGEVIAQGQVDLESGVGQEAWRSFKNRSIGFSFGYMILESTDRKGGGRHITELDVFEVTATPTPMNNETRVLSTKAWDGLRSAYGTLGMEVPDSLKSFDPSTAEEDATVKEPNAATTQAPDPLYKESMAFVRDDRTEGAVRHQPHEEPKPKPPAVEDLRREHRDLMTELLR